MPGLIALQERHVEGSGAVGKENLELEHTAQGRRQLLRGTEGHLHHTGSATALEGLSSLETPGAGLWPQGSQSHKQRNPNESQGKSNSLWPTSGRPTLWKCFPQWWLVQESGAAGAEPAAWGNHGSSFQGPVPSPACGSSATVIAVGSFQRFPFSHLISAKVVCALRHLPSYSVTGKIQTSKTNANPLLARSGGEAGSCQPFPQVFASGAYWCHVWSTRVAARFSARIRLGWERGAAWRGCFTVEVFAENEPSLPGRKPGETANPPLCLAFT